MPNMTDMASATFRTMRHKGSDLPIHWQGRKYTHACEGADIHRDVRLIWTLCEIDVPANASYLPVGVDSVTCPKCKEART